MNDFIQKWHKLREIKKSNIIAGLDPAVFNMGRGDKGLCKDVNILEWIYKYIETVAPYVVGIKSNLGYFQSADMMSILTEVNIHIKNLGLINIGDAKISDIGSTNDAWIYYLKNLNFDAVIFAPYAGNIEACVKSSHNFNMGAITMGLMSNPEYKTEMNFKDGNNVDLWRTRVNRALESNVDALVVGGTYTLTDQVFLNFVEMTKDSNVLYLVPGIGAQGGDIKEFLASSIDPKRCMINSGRNVMFPQGNTSTPYQQAQAVKKLRDDFNNLIR